MADSFVQAQWYHHGRRGYNGDGKIHGVVIHSMEAPEKGTTAESTAQFFANGSGGRPSSADKCIDSNSVVDCIKSDEQEAYHAPPASRWTKGYEHAGYARQTAADWHDPFSWAMLQLSAAELAKDAAHYGFPLVYLSQADLKAGKIDGVTMHNDVSQVWHQSQHWDPGPSFPMEEYLQMARNGAHTVEPPKATKTFKRGDHGAGVGFLQAMLNIVAKFRINSEGKAGGKILKINKADPGYGPSTEEAVREFQRFLVVMWKLNKDPNKSKTPPAVDGIAGPEVAKGLAFWVPLALKK